MKTLTKPDWLAGSTASVPPYARNYVIFITAPAVGSSQEGGASAVDVLFINKIVQQSIATNNKYSYECR